MKGLRILALGAFLAAVLGGCYIPVRFDAEIELTRGGYYDMIFDGYMADVGLFDGINKGKISPARKERKSKASRPTSPGTSRPRNSPTLSRDTSRSIGGSQGI